VNLARDPRHPQPLCGTHPHRETNVLAHRRAHPYRQRPRTHRALFLATAFATAAAAVGIGSAAMASGLPSSAARLSPAAAATSASITVTGTASGHALPADFIGLSLEADSLSDGDFAGSNLADYLKELGPTGILRIGGNSADETFWTSTGQSAPSWSEGTITPASLSSLDSAISGTGWKVILAVNLEEFSTSRAADEAKYAEQILGSSLDGIEIGNEPNYYYTSDSTYFSDFESYVSAIRAAVPGIPIVGPDAGHDQPAFVAAFAQDEAADPDISMLTDHEYPLSDCDGATNTISDLLSASSDTTEKAAADSAVAGGVLDKVPAVMDETNSITCGGQSGVSNVFASTLWSLDYSLLLAQEGVQGADFHGQISGCGPYSPLCVDGSGSLAAQPLFYGFLAVQQVGTGSFLTVDNADSANVRAYAVQNGSGLTVVLDDVQDPSSYGATDVTLSLPQSYSQAQSTVLATSSSAGLSATSGITLGGQQISDSGAFPAPTYTAVPISGSTVTVPVAAGSATILKLGGGSGGTQPTTFIGGLSGKCLSVSGASTADGATAEIWTCNSSPSENWTVGSNDAIVGGLSGECLEVAGSSTANYAGVDIGTCDGAANQQWTVNSGGTVVGTQSGKCLSVTGAATANGALADIYTCNGSPSENWAE
jgi:Ricin-type beta-trefoil lectin domain